ncbi:MAG: DUF5666 domain-containing protein [Candidatus Pacebacteria bacterium]|nr:DUF5666 domain-containing protein [Candidatus Paceibacterota bacterium]MCF7862816.1 DUF5666 domain-containing protein [Candidatus Paceibacterota bacterium]
MDIKEYLKSSSFKGVIIGLSIGVFLLVIFQSGVLVGYKRAMFSNRMGNNFNKNFVDPRGRGMGMMGEKFGKGNMSVGHGAAGKIISIGDMSLVVADAENLEKMVLINEDTVVRKFRDDIKFADLKVGDFVVVFGAPNENGGIDAKLIRNTPEISNNMKNGVAPKK